MTATATTVTGTCGCGIEVTRQRAEGFGSHILNALPFFCPNCSAEREAAWEKEDRAEQGRHDRQRLALRLESLPAALRGARLDELDTDGRAPRSTPRDDGRPAS